MDHQPCFPPQVLSGLYEEFGNFRKMKSAKRVLWKGRGSCPQLGFKRVLNFEEVEILHKSHSTLLWSEWLGRLVVHRELDKFSMGVDLCKFWKLSKVGRMQNEKEGSVLYSDLKGFWILKRSKFYTSPIVPSCGPPTLLPSSVHWSGTSLLWEWTCANFAKSQSVKRVKGKIEGVVLYLYLKGFWILKRSTESGFVWGGPMSLNLASHQDPWSTEEV